MKSKLSFVTNSSSASFILRFETLREMTVEEFTNIFNRYLEHRRHLIENLRFWDASTVKQVEPNIFVIEEWTSMYNDMMDIPEYMRLVLVESFLDDFSLLDLKFVGFKVQPDY